jgi:catalase
MSAHVPVAFAIGISLLLLAAPAAADNNEVTPDQVVTALEETFGVTPGQRRNHIKGTCATGEFVGTADAAKLSRSALFSGKAIPVMARFSLPGGNPKVPDSVKNVRGMALEFRISDNDVQHMTMLNVPIFGAAQPKTFFDLIVALKPDPQTKKPDPERVKAFKASHPDNRGLSEYLAAHNPPPSYANAAFYGIHTFKFVDGDKNVTPVRWRFDPQAGEKMLSDEELKSSPPDFLEQRLIEATQNGSVRWDMIVTIGQPGDPQDDPTQYWPKDRQEIKAGTLTISSASPQSGAACEKINFDPMVMADGIEPTNDPILQFRSPAYAVSYSKRLNGE